MAVGGGLQVGVFRRLLGGGHVLQAQGGAVLVAEHQLAVLGGATQLVVGVDGDGMVGAVETALGAVDVGRIDHRVDVFQGQAVGGQGLGVDVDAHRRLLAAGQGHQADPGNLRQLQRQAGVDQILHLGQWQAVRGGGQGQHRGVGRIDLLVGGRIGQVVRQEAVGGVDRGLHLLLGDVQRQAEIELQSDHRGAGRTGRIHLRQTGHLPQLALQRRGHRGGQHLGAGPGIEGGDLDDGIVHLRQCRDGQQAIAQDAGEQHRHHQQHRGHRPLDEQPRRIHRLASAAGVAATRTWAPSRRWSIPRVTTRSSPLSPWVTATRSPSAGPVVMPRRSTLSSAPTT
ncbi:hypothetical protein Q3H58_004947 [Pseudomonas psychrotolerans]|nr:hypothetical protein [Pseudomonas psychrotolerans]